MRNLIASFLALHWSAAFALAAVLCASGGASGIDALIAMFGNVAPQETAGWWSTPLVTGLFATTLAAVALLFFWVFVTAMFGDGEQDADDAARVAFAVAILVMTAILVVGTFAGVAGLAGMIALQIAGLGVSYIAVAAELAVRRTRPPVASSARLLALGAAIEAPLGRISGREPAKAGQV